MILETSLSFIRYNHHILFEELSSSKSFNDIAYTTHRTTKTSFGNPKEWVMVLPSSNDRICGRYHVCRFLIYDITVRDYSLWFLFTSFERHFLSNLRLTSYIIFPHLRIIFNFFNTCVFSYI